MNNHTPIDETFFDAAFKGRLSDNKQFKPISNERAAEIMAECFKFHEEVYLPAEKLAEEIKGSPLSIGEQMILQMELQFGSKDK